MMEVSLIVFIAALISLEMQTTSEADVFLEEFSFNGNISFWNFRKWGSYSAQAWTPSNDSIVLSDKVWETRIMWSKAIFPDGLAGLRIEYTMRMLGQGGSDGAAMFFTRPELIASTSTGDCCRTLGILRNFTGFALIPAPYPVHKTRSYFSNSSETNMTASSQQIAITNATTTMGMYGENTVFVIEFFENDLYSSYMRSDNGSMMVLANNLTVTGLNSLGPLVMGVSVRNGASYTNISVKSIKTFAKNDSPDREKCAALDQASFPGRAFAFEHLGQTLSGSSLKGMCPVDRKAADGTRLFEMTCQPWNDPVWNPPPHCYPTGNLSCITDCNNGGVCSFEPSTNQSFCLCPAGYMQPDCRFHQSYLPGGAVAFFPISTNTFYFENASLLKLLEKTGGTATGILSANVGYRINTTDQFCADCDSSIGTFTFKTVQSEFAEIKTQDSLPTGEVETLLLKVFIGASQESDRNTQPILTWRGSNTCSVALWANATNHLIAGYEVRSNVNPSSGSYLKFETPLILSSGTWHHLNVKTALSGFDFKLDQESFVAQVDSPGFNLCRPVASPANFYLGGGSAFINFGNFTPAQDFAKLIDNNSAACFGVYNRELSSEEVDLFYDACNHEFGSTKVPTPTSTTTTTTTTFTPITSLETITAALLGPSPQHFVLKATAESRITGDIILPSLNITLTSDPWPQDLDNTSSKLFIEFGTLLTPPIELIYQSTGAFAEIKVTITRFRPGSFIADYVVALRSLTQLSDKEIERKVQAEIAKMQQQGKVIPGVDIYQFDATSSTVSNVGVISSPTVGKTLSNKVQAAASSKTSKGSLAYSFQPVLLFAIILASF